MQKPIVGKSITVSSISIDKKYKNFRYILLATSIVTFLLIIMGNVVRVSTTTAACPDWPTCFGQWTMPLQLEARLQTVHRVLALISTLMIIASTIVAWRWFRQERWVKWPLTLASYAMKTEVVLGGVEVLLGSSLVLAAFHYILALLALGLVITSLIATFSLDNPNIDKIHLDYRSRFGKITLITTLGIILLMISGTIVAGAGAGSACSGLPLCLGQSPISTLGWLEIGHQLLSGLVSGLVVTQFFMAWKGQRKQRVLLPAATGVFILFLGQVMVGALKVSRGYPADLVGLHATSAAALWAVQAILVVASGLTSKTVAEEQGEPVAQAGSSRRLRDFFLLNKPVIVLLLLVTTYAGLVLGSRRLPGLELTFWTLLGGALAAGGSSALNQYIDRDLDKEMQRTARRPLPAGRLEPAEGLAYGLGACLAAFFILAGFVNLLSAVLAFLGMIYYVLIYSIWLKKLTVQNIVIGGGAGAIPPLVGWAAASGSLNIPSLFLFAIVFLWTPPHFWALALVRQKDYARASVPMLPVVRGEKTTRWQIFIYTIELVSLTLLMPLLRITGSIFLISAVILGGWLIYSAWRVLKKEGNKPAYMMYRYSSMYLALLFLALVLDVLL